MPYDNRTPFKDELKNVSEEGLYGLEERLALVGPEERAMMLQMLKERYMEQRAISDEAKLSMASSVGLPAAVVGGAMGYGTGAGLGEAAATAATRLDDVAGDAFVEGAGAKIDSMPEEATKFWGDHKVRKMKGTRSVYPSREAEFAVEGRRFKEQLKHGARDIADDLKFGRAKAAAKMAAGSVRGGGVGGAVAGAGINYALSDEDIADPYGRMSDADTQRELLELLNQRAGGEEIPGRQIDPAVAAQGVLDYMPDMPPVTLYKGVKLARDKTQEYMDYLLRK